MQYITSITTFVSMMKIMFPYPFIACPANPTFGPSTFSAPPYMGYDIERKKQHYCTY